jgi:hypothetical protein
MDGFTYPVGTLVIREQIGSEGNTGGIIRLRVKRRSGSLKSSQCMELQDRSRVVGWKRGKTMLFSLIIVSKRNTDGTIDGTFLQNKTADSLKEAIEFTKKTKAVNGNKIDIGIIEGTSGYIAPVTFMMLREPLAIV